MPADQFNSFSAVGTKKDPAAGTTIAELDFPQMVQPGFFFIDVYVGFGDTTEDTNSDNIQVKIDEATHVLSTPIRSTPGWTQKYSFKHNLSDDAKITVSNIKVGKGNYKAQIIMNKQG